jgi:hypothetical protein
MTPDNRHETAGQDDGATRTTPRQRAIDAYANARDSLSGAGQRATDTLGEAPLIALAGGLAAGALIAALLPRTEAETRAIRPTARRVRDTAREAARVARQTGTEQLSSLGLTREKGEETIRSLLDGVTGAVKASGQAALDAARKR